MEMMYPNGRTADNIKIQTWACEIDNRNNMLYVETGTTGYQGRGAEHDSRTYFRIENKVGTDIRAKAIPEKPEKTDNAEIIKALKLFSAEIPNFLLSMRH